MATDKQTDIALLLLRLTFGGSMIIGHGYPKLMRFFSDEPIKFLNFLGLSPEVSLGLATFAELGCAALVVIGLFTRWATLPLIITMFVAIFVANWGEPFSSIEKALMFMMAFVSILLAGPGWYSVDAQARSGI